MSDPEKKEETPKPPTLAEKVADYQAHFDDATYHGASVSGEQSRAHKLIYELLARVEELEKEKSDAEAAKKPAEIPSVPAA